MTTEKSILITRELHPGSLIRKWAAENAVTLIEKPFIETAAVKDLPIPKTDWIFFSSPQGVRLYFQHYPLLAPKIAALSDGTARELSQLGYSAHFIGKSNQTTRETGRDFFTHISPSETVLFPLSDISKKHISSQKNNHTVIELVTYKTIPRGEAQDIDPDVILFTSPSNADGFLLKNKPGSTTKILAIGATTADHLRKLGFTELSVSESTHEKALIKQLERML